MHQTAPLLFGEGWVAVRDADVRARMLFERHYSARQYRDGRARHKFVGPGEYVVLLLAPGGDALFVWRRFLTEDPVFAGRPALNCAVFRNESGRLSSDLILEAEARARQRWPDEPAVYTYVNAAKVRSTNPGYCFLRAGWRKAGRTKGGLVRLVKDWPRACS